MPSSSSTASPIPVPGLLGGLAEGGFSTGEAAGPLPTTMASITGRTSSRTSKRQRDSATGVEPVRPLDVVYSIQAGDGGMCWLNSATLENARYRECVP